MAAPHGDCKLVGQITQTLSTPRHKNISLYTNSDLRYKPPIHPAEGRWPSSRCRWGWMRWTLRRQAGLLAGRNAAAYGEIVWFWRRDPGATLLVRPSEQRGQERPLPGESTYKPPNIARGRPGSLGCTRSVTPACF